MAAAAAGEAKRKPGWMSIPGGPKEPNFTEFRTKFSSLIEEKKKCFDALKDIRAEFDAARGNNEKTEVDKERSQLRDKISKIDADRKKERENRRAADDRIKEVRDQRNAIQAELDRLYDDVGAFKDIAEIDMAIDLVMLKLETGAASLKAEKECIKRLSKLEDAKGLLQKLEPLAEAIADATEREMDLRQESREIHTRIAELNADYEKNLSAKMEKDKERTKTSVDFSGLHKKRETVNAKIETLNKQIDDLRANFDKAQDAWKAWRIEAQEKFVAKITAEREERERAWREREEARRLERRRAKAAKKLNPHKVEIDICGTLITYLEQKVKIHARDVEEAEKRKKLATFDPSANAPKGAVVKKDSEDDWLFGDRTVKVAKPAKPAKKDDKAPAAASNDKKNPEVKHSEEKKAAFAQVKIEAPTTYSSIDDTIKALKALKKDFESKIVVNPDDVDVTSSDDEAAAEVADDSTVVASTAAPAA